MAEGITQVGQNNLVEDSARTWSQGREVNVHPPSSPTATA